MGPNKAGLSLLVFIIATEILCIFTKTLHIALLDVTGDLLLSDDTTIFMKLLSEAPKIIPVINCFSEASPLKLDL